MDFSLFSASHPSTLHREKCALPVVSCPTGFLFCLVLFQYWSIVTGSTETVLPALTQQAAGCHRDLGRPCWLQVFCSALDWLLPLLS